MVDSGGPREGASHPMVGPGALAEDLFTVGGISPDLYYFPCQALVTIDGVSFTGQFWGFLLVSFLCGSIPFTWLIARARGFDLLTTGSGNPGATNLSRVVGRGYGAAGLLLDVAKGLVPVFFFQQTSDNLIQSFLIGGIAVVGHCYSPFLRGKGGKGVATTGGVLLALEPGIALTMLAIWALVRLVLRSVGMASVGAALTGVVIAFSLIFWAPLVDPLIRMAPTPASSRQILGGVLLALSCLVVVRHRSNIHEYLQCRREEGQR